MAPSLRGGTPPTRRPIVTDVSMQARSIFPTGLQCFNFLERSVVSGQIEKASTLTVSAALRPAACKGTALPDRLDAHALQQVGSAL